MVSFVTGWVKKSGSFNFDSRHFTCIENWAPFTPQVTSPEGVGVGVGGGGGGGGGVLTYIRTRVCGAHSCTILDPKNIFTPNCRNRHPISDQTKYA